MTRSSNNTTLAAFAADRGLDGDGLVQLARQVGAAHHTAAAQAAQAAERDALYASCFPSGATTEAPDPLYDALFGKGS